MNAHYTTEQFHKIGESEQQIKLTSNKFVKIVGYNVIFNHQIVADKFRDSEKLRKSLLNELVMLSTTIRINDLEIAVEYANSFSEKNHPIICEIWE